MGVYDVESQVGGYGSAGGAAFRGFQQELLRAAAMKQMAEEQQRKNAQDALDAEMKRAALANTTESTKSLVEQRKAAAAKDALAAAIAPLAPGQTLTPEQSTALKSSGGGGFVFAKPATPALEAGGPIENLTPEDVAATPAVEAQPATETFTGTPEQRTEQTQRAALQHIIDTTEPDSPIHQWALTQQTGKAAPPGVIVPKPSASETKSAHDLAMEKLEARTITGYKPTADEAAALKVWKSRKPTTAEQEANRVTNINLTGNIADTRQARTQLFQMKQKFRDDIKAEDAKLTPDLERVDRAKKVLDSPNFLSDALAAPEVLQIMAGGMGSGLRMTDAELNRVNQAQTKLDQLRGEVAKYGLGTPVTIQETMRAQMKTLIDTVQKARERHARLLEDTRAKISDADTPEQLDQMVSDFMGKRRETINLEGGATGPAEGTLGTVNGKPAVWKNGSKGLGWYAR